MPVYNVCLKCYSGFGLNHKKCTTCGTPLPKTNKKYRVIAIHNKKRITEIIQSSLELARDIEKKIKLEMIEGKYFDRKIVSKTLNEVWELYLQSYKARGKSWFKEEQRYNYMLKEKFGNKSLSNITPFDIETYQASLKNSLTKYNKPYSNKTIKNTIDLLSIIFNYAIKYELCDKENPCNNVKRPKINNIVTNALNPEQQRKLLDVLSDYPNRQIANILKLLLFTGMRKGEAFKLKWQHVDLNAQRLHLVDPKGGKDEILPLNLMALEALKAQETLKQKGNDLVFSHNWKKFIDIGWDWRKIKTLANLPVNIRIHDLRHTFASILANSGKADLHTIQRLLTHKSPTMTLRYAHLVESSLKKATCIIDDLYKSEKSNENVIPFEKAM